MIRDLLKRWSELEPERCEFHEGSAELLDGLPNPWIINFSAIAVEFRRYDQIALLNAVMTAIDDRNLRLKLENDGNGYFATVREVDQAHPKMSHDPIATVALLKAYLAWLEQSP